MKVYLVVEQEAYETSTLLGIFSTKELAERVKFGDIIEFKLDDYVKYDGNLKWKMTLDPSYSINCKYNISIYGYAYPIQEGNKESNLIPEQCDRRTLYRCEVFAKTYEEAQDKTYELYKKMIK